MIGNLAYFCVLYLRCVFANKILYLIYIATILNCNLLLMSATHHLWFPWGILDIILVAVCFFGLWLLNFGVPTLASYTQTMLHYQEHSCIDRRFARAMLQSPYCNRAGFELAMKDIIRRETTP